MTDFRLDGHTALVTGASRGLGLDIADTLYELGAIVYGTSRDPASAEQLALRWSTSPVVLDVSDARASAAVVDALFASGAGPTLLVNNAGANRPQPALDVDEEAWDALYSANIRGLFFISQAVARHWVELGTPGAIVNIGSQAGRVAIEDRSVYGSTKAAVEQLTRNLAFEWGVHGIRVNNVAPTFVRTELTKATLANGEFADTLLSRMPLGRFGEPADVSGAVAFLLGGRAAMITGQTLLVDGGYTIH